MTAQTQAAATSWVHTRGELAIESARVMAIVNVTPDSFSDGGELWGADGPALRQALFRCRQAVACGADILDVGGESTRPGAEPVSPDQEAMRVLPVVRAIAGDPQLAHVPLSIDTRRALVADQALRAGACIVNDISGLADPAMLDVVASHNAGLVLGHLRGEPQTMQHGIAFTDLLGDVAQELCQRVEAAVAAGISRSQILVDPGIGFGKTAAQSAALVGCAAELRRRTGCHVLIGASRKSFLGALTGRPVDQRELASVVAAVHAVARGAAVVRVHDVAPTVEALALAAALRRADEHPGRLHLQ